MIIIIDYPALLLHLMHSYRFAFATDRVHDGKPLPLFTTSAGLSAIIINNGCSSGPFKCYGTRGGGVHNGGVCDQSFSNVYGATLYSDEGAIESKFERKALSNT